MSEYFNRRSTDIELQEHRLEEEKRLIEIEHNIKSLEDKIDKLQTDVADLVSAWKAAGWLVGVVKWLGGLAIAGTAIITFMKGK